MPTELSKTRPALSSGLYALAAGRVDPNQERYYVIYWPEDSTWDDSAAASVCWNRVTFMRWVFVDACVDDHIVLSIHNTGILRKCAIKSLRCYRQSIPDL